MTGRGSHFNRANRRGGGARRPIIRVGDPALGDLPALSFACYEGRHAECRGSGEPWFPEACQCAHHEPPTQDREPGRAREEGE